MFFFKLSKILYYIINSGAVHESVSSTGVPIISVFTSTSNAPTNVAPCILTHGLKEAEKGALVKEWNSRRWCPGSWEASEDRGMIGCDLPPLLALFKGAVYVCVCFFKHFNITM